MTAWAARGGGTAVSFHPCHLGEVLTSQTFGHHPQLRADIIMSLILGLADRIYPAVPKPHTLRFFSRGWGDMDRSARGVAFFRSWVESNGYDNCDAAPISLDRPAERGARVQGTFRSPLADFLPQCAQRCSFELLMPRGIRRPHAIVVLFSGIGDQTLVYRRVMLASALLEVGIGVVCIMPPLYGERRPAEQPLHYVETVELLLLQTVALQSEALRVLSWLRHEAYPDALLGVGGLSWGGTCAACVGAIWDGPIAIVSICASPSFDPLLEGALDGDLNWAALIAEMAEVAEGSDPIDAARRRLREEFDHFSFERLVESAVKGRVERDPRTLRLDGCAKSALHIIARHDAFVVREQSQRLHAMMMQMVPRAKLVEVPGGHVSTFVLAPVLAATMPRTIAHLSKEMQRSCSGSGPTTTSADAARAGPTSKL